MWNCDILVAKTKCNKLQNRVYLSLYHWRSKTKYAICEPSCLGLKACRTDRDQKRHWTTASSKLCSRRLNCVLYQKVLCAQNCLIAIYSFMFLLKIHHTLLVCAYMLLIETLEAPELWGAWLPTVRTGCQTKVEESLQTHFSGRITHSWPTLQQLTGYWKKFELSWLKLNHLASSEVMKLHCSADMTCATEKLCGCVDSIYFSWCFRSIRCDVNWQEWAPYQL